MADTNFIAGQQIPLSWIQDVNNAVYRGLGVGGVVPTTLAQTLANIGAAALQGNAAVQFSVAAATGANQATTLSQVQALIAAAIPTSGVTSFNTRTGAVTLTSADVTGALGYTPASSSSSVSSFNTRTGAVTLTSADVTGALGFTPTSSGGSPFNVKASPYNAKGDGTTDDTAAIMACDTAARAAGAAVYFPSGNYAVSQLVMSSNSIWFGDGPDATVLTQIVGSNKSLITLNGIVAQRVQLRDLSIDGNYNMGAGNTAGDGVDWSAGVAAPIMVNVYLGNIAGNALHTYWSDSQIPGGNQGYPAFRWSMEGYFANIKVFQCGQHGWLNYGPHDSTVIGFLVCNSGQAANNTYDAFHFAYTSGYGAGANGNFFYLHGYQLSNSTNRNRSALYIESGVTGCRFIGCQFEGAYTPVTLLGNNNNFDSTCAYYASWNSTTIYMGGPSCNGNSIRGHIDGPVSGRPAAAGIVFGSASTEQIILNDIDVMMANQEAGNIIFTSAVHANNVIRINAFYNATAATFSGTPDPTDDFQIRGMNSNGMWHRANRVQQTSLLVPAGSSATWTFPFPFAAEPIITGGMSATSSAALSQPYGTSGSATYVTIHNPNSIDVSVNMVATAAT